MRLSVLFLAALAGATSGAVPGDPRDDEVVRALERSLRADRPEERRSAVRKLSEIGTPRAWAGVLAALDDAESAVADEAQLRVAAIDDPRSQAELLGPAGLGSRRERVCLRSAEALGRSAADVDGAKLVSAFSSEPELTRTLLWSIERLARAGRLSGERERIAAAALGRARRAGDGGVRAAAVMALDALASPSSQPADARWIEDACKDSDPGVRCAGLLAARALPAEPALALARALAEDEAWPVRLVALESLERLASREAALALVRRLELETTEHVIDRLVAALRRLSGLKHRRDPRPWRGWVDGLERTWSPAGPPPEAAPQQAGPVTRASFVGLPVLSSRITFLIDFSGSMWMPMSDGRMPKDVVDRRLREVLEGFDPDTRFNVIPFANEPAPWQERLVPARPNHVKAALADFERCALRGRGNFFAAAVLALEDPEVETVATLTDGVPTGGFHSDLELIVPLLLERNRFRRVRFDSILVDCPAGLRRHWEALAAASGGRCLTMEHM